MTVYSVKTGNESIGLLAGNTSAISDFESIATISVGSGGSSTVTFTSIPQGYTHLQLRASIGNNPSSYDITGAFIFNGDTGNNYSQHVLYGTGSTAGVYTVSSNTNVNLIGIWSSGSGIEFAPAVIDILDYSSTDKFKTFRTLTGAEHNGSGSSVFGSAIWLSTSPITSFMIQGQYYGGYTSFGQHSHFALYGIKAV